MKVGSAFAGNAGGTTGPMWGTAFLRAGINSKEKQAVNLSDLVLMGRAAIAGMMARGNAVQGDKTLLDALIPAVDKLEEYARTAPGDLVAAFESAASVAVAAIEGTRQWPAKRGRQSYAGDRTNVFAAPPMEYVLECTRLMNSKKGVLHLINNYTGDRAAWEMARELAEAEGLQIGVVLINDDVAVMDSAYTVGRRGVAGNFFVIKTCGAAAAKGADLADLVKLGEKVVSVVRTMGLAISGCRPPGKDKPIFELAAGEMEMGVGIHGEKGRRRAPLPKADAVVDDQRPRRNAAQRTLFIVPARRPALCGRGL